MVFLSGLAQNYQKVNDFFLHYMKGRLTQFFLAHLIGQASKMHIFSKNLFKRTELQYDFFGTEKV